MFDFNEYQRQFPNDGDKRENADSAVRHLLYRHRSVPHLVCADGFIMSVQASEMHYCTPRVTGSPAYSEVEVGFPSERQEELIPYAEEARKPTETVYGYTPVGIINAIVEKHGGLKV